MEYIVNGLREALILIVSFQRDLLLISWTSVWISSISITIATIIALPLAFIITSSRFRWKKSLLIFLNTLLFLPTVTVGLIVYSFFCRKGPFGNLHLLYTPFAMIIGQVILATPIIIALTISSVKQESRNIELTALTLGASKIQCGFLLMKERRRAVVASVIAGFGRIFSEVGISMMVGGNIKNYTRNIPTAIALETSKGEFSLGLALGLVLLFIALMLNLLIQGLSRYETV